MFRVRGFLPFTRVTECFIYIVFTINRVTPELRIFWAWATNKFLAVKTSWYCTN